MYTIGIDLGGTNIVAGAVKDGNEILCKKELPTAMPRSPESIADDMAALAKAVSKEAGIGFDAVDYVGIGVPGSVDAKNGVVKYANNINFTDVPLKKIMEERLSKPMYLENDANAAAIGEFESGAAKGYDSVAVITLGTGIGAGIILDGKIISGLNFAAGEIGHSIVQMNGIPCNCGRRGCWEAYASVTALIEQTKAAMLENRTSAMWSIADGSLENVNGKTAFDAMRMGDEAGSAVSKQFIEYVGVGIVNVINILEPQLICIGGGISKEGETLLSPVRRMVEKESYSRNSKTQPQICAAALGNNAGLIGAATLRHFQ